MHSFINKYSAKCLLGPMSKDYKFNGSLFTWKVMKKSHFTIVDDLLNDDDINTLKNSLKEYDSIGFHYILEDNLKILQKHFKVNRTKLKSSITTVNDLKFCGKKLRRFRNYINRYKDLTILDNYVNHQDVADMIDNWSNTSAQKYFRDFSGKNNFFMKNNFHKDCESVFVYKDEKLISFGVASPVIDGKCSYIIGKALCLEYPGLSEFTDIKLYDKILNKYGSFDINLGQAKSGLEFYKGKFPNTRFEVHYDGKIKV